MLAKRSSLGQLRQNIYITGTGGVGSIYVSIYIYIHIHVVSSPFLLASLWFGTFIEDLRTEEGKYNGDYG